MQRPETPKVPKALDATDTLDRFRLAAAAGGVGIWDWNLQKVTTWSSEETRRLYDLLSGEDLSFERWIELIHPDDTGRVERQVREALSGAGGYDVEFRVRSPKDEERWVWAKGQVIFDGAGNPVRVVSVHVDIASRKQRDVERALAEGESRKASELKDEFLAMLGHELRNPIGAIANGIELLRGDAARDHRDWAVAMIERQTRQLKRLVDDILEVSRVTRGQLEIRPEVVSLSTCVETARDAIRKRLAENPREFDVHLPNERIQLFADPARMEQILGNLLLNAIRYTDPGGRIELSADRDGDRIFIRVEDDGEGLTEEHLNVIFEPFVRVSKSLRRAGSGLGIGLTLVKKLVELHGGTVTAESPGAEEGCTFTVELPIHEGEVARQEDEKPNVPRPLRILVIDDNKDLAQGLQRRLIQQGHEAALAHDGPEGIAAARHMKPDVVLIDIVLPRMDGYEVAAKLRAEASTEMWLAAISGFKERGEEEIAVEVFDHYFLKPVDAEQLQTWLLRVADEKRGGRKS